MNCDRARRLFGACWDDELTVAERDWLEGHFTSCARCRVEYDGLSRALELAGTLPRVEASTDLVERVLARARRTSTVPDRVGGTGVRWVPVAAAAAAAVVVVAALLVIPQGRWRSPGSGERAGMAARGSRQATPVPVLRTRATAEAPAAAAKLPARHPAVAGNQVAAIPDSLFDHSEDVEFILDPVTLHRGRASVSRSGARRPSVEGEQTIITF